MLEAMIADEKDAQYGWFWQLKNLPAAPESRYLYTVLAGHDFQEGLKNYRDLAFMGNTLNRWGESMTAFEDMIDTRERAYAERLPRADARLAAGTTEKLQQSREELQDRLNSVESTGDVAALGSVGERGQWAQIQRLESALASAPAGEETEALRERLRLVKGVLYFRLSEEFKERMWQQRRSIKDLDAALREAQNRWVRVEKARKSVPTDTGEFAARIAALRQRIDALQLRLAESSKKQNAYLSDLAVASLEAQKDRLATYQVQARFALASMYDRAANPPASAPSAAPAQKSDEPTKPEAPEQKP
jgi:chromosome segregation ATPase